MFYIVERLRTLERLDKLISLKATGSPSELARRLGVSKRTISNLIDELRAFGAEIHFDRCRNSYIYSQPVEFRFDIATPVKNSHNITGGQNKLPNILAKAKYMHPVHLGL